jgi:hypothetical protein
MYRGINKFKRGYQPRCNLVKDENGILRADSPNILNWCYYYFSHLLNVDSVSDVMQIEIRTKEPLAPGSNPLEVEIAMTKLKKCKSAGSDQIPSEPIQAGGETLLSEIRVFINSIWDKKELPDQWKESLNVPFHRKGDETVCNNYRGISLLSASYSYNILSNILLSRLGP